MIWLSKPDVSLKRMAVQFFGVFVEAEKGKFEPRLKELLPELIKLLELSSGSGGEEENREVDLLLIKVQYTLLKMMEHCGAGVKKVDIIDITDALWDRIVQHLMHPHVWIRTLSARLVGTLLGWHNVNELATYATNPSLEVSRTYLLCPELTVRLRSLASVSVAQLQTGLLDNQLADQVVKNLVFIAKIANRIPVTASDQKEKSLIDHQEEDNEKDKDQQEDDEKDKDQQENDEEDKVHEEVNGKEGKEKVLSPPTLIWLIGKLRREINAEVNLRPTIPIKVKTCF